METIYLTTSNLETPVTHQPGGVVFIFCLIFLILTTIFLRPTVGTSSCDTGLWLASRTTPSWPQPSCRAMCTSKFRGCENKSQNSQPKPQSGKQISPNTNESPKSSVTSASVDFPSCRTYKHLLPSCQNAWVVSPPNGLSVHPVRIPWAKTTKKLLDEEALWGCPPNTPRKKVWLSTIMSSPQKGWCFSSHPEISGKCISITRVIRINPPTPPLQLLRHVRHQESRTPGSSAVPTVWKTLQLSAWSLALKTQIPHTDGNRNTEMLNRRPTVGLFHPALSSGKTHTKTPMECWKISAIFFVLLQLVQDLHVNVG